MRISLGDVYRPTDKLRQELDEMGYIARYLRPRQRISENYWDFMTYPDRCVLLLKADEVTFYNAKMEAI